MAFTHCTVHHWRYDRVKNHSKLEELGDVYLMMSLKDADFTGKPSVLLVGQYSTGKTTLIRFQTY